MFSPACFSPTPLHMLKGVKEEFVDRVRSLQARSRSRRSPEAHGGAALLRGAAP